MDDASFTSYLEFTDAEVRLLVPLFQGVLINNKALNRKG